AWREGCQDRRRGGSWGGGARGLEGVDQDALGLTGCSGRRRGGLRMRPRGRPHGDWRPKPGPKLLNHRRGAVIPCLLKRAGHDGVLLVESYLDNAFVPNPGCQTLPGGDHAVVKAVENELLFGVHPWRHAKDCLDLLMFHPLYDPVAVRLVNE